MEIVKPMNRGGPCCAWKTDEESHVLEGIHGIGARASFEELLAPWMCLWCESQIISSDVEKRSLSCL